METIRMSAKERARLEVFGRVRAGDLTLVKASELLGLSYRQTKRSWSRYREEGDVALVHGLRGQVSNRQGNGEKRAMALQLYADKYSDYGPTLATECMATDDGVQVPVETLRRWLLAAGLWSRKRQRKAHRRRRPRKEQFGELVQMDGSIHDWFEGRRGQAVLMVLIDDATGRTFARFFERETLSAAWTSFRSWVEQFGLPGAVYVDRHSIYRSDRDPTAEELLAGEDPPTQFGRSMKELNVRLIKARSPQAKGRVERMNGTLQDRLVKAMRRANVCDLERANRFLEEEFLSPFNERFMVPAEKSGDFHRPLSKTTDLARILAVQEERVVQNDWTVRWRNRFLQLSRETAALVQPGMKVTVCELLDGSLRLFHGETELPWSSTRSEPVIERKREGEIRSNQGQRPAADHPWRKLRPYRRSKPAPPPNPISPELASSAPDSLRSSSAALANSDSS
jgi:transposase